MTTSNTLVANKTHRRDAPCHRCGWTQPLLRIERREQVRLSSTERYRWLCDDCVRELTGAGVAEKVAVGAPDTEVAAAQHGRTRSVA